MKVKAIKKLVDQKSLSDLVAAETALVEDRAMPFEVEGDDEGEKLMHIIAATWIINCMQSHKINFTDALKKYSAKVRECISN